MLLVGRRELDDDRRVAFDEGEEGGVVKRRLAWSGEPLRLSWGRERLEEASASSLPEELLETGRIVRTERVVPRREPTTHLDRSSRFAKKVQLEHKVLERLAVQEQEAARKATRQCESQRPRAKDEP